MYSHNKFTDLEQTLTPTVLEILSTIVVSGRALYCILLMWLLMCHFGKGHPDPYITDLLEKGWIQHSTSQYSHNLLFV